MCAPGRRNARSRMSVAAMPDANARPKRAPSSSAMAPSSAADVGLATRVYSNPPRRTLMPSWAKVELA